MARDKGPSKPASSKSAPTKKLAISSGRVQKKKTHERSKGKKKATVPLEIFHVRMRSRGSIYGHSSLDEDTHYEMYPPSLRDGDMSRDSPPSSPVRGNVFTDVKPYRFDSAPTFPTPAIEERYRSFVDAQKVPLSLLYPDQSALERLGIDVEVGGLMRVSGLHMLFREDPGMHTAMVMEFMSSFEAVEEKSVLTGWRFALGGKLWEVEVDVLRDWFRFPRGGHYPFIPEDGRVWTMWEGITGHVYSAEKHHFSSYIREPVWRVIHRFIACCFFVRTDGGRFVSRTELSIMSHMRDGKRIDWIEALTKGLQDNQGTGRRNRSLGGGSFITRIAQKLYFSFEGDEPLRESLTIPAMVARRMIGKDMRWHVKGADRDEERAADAADEEDDSDWPEIPPSHPFYEAPPTSDPADIAGPSSSSQPPPPSPMEQQMELLMALVRAISGRLSGMEASQAALKRGQEELLRGQIVIRVEQSQIRRMIETIGIHVDPASYQEPYYTSPPAHTSPLGPRISSPSSDHVVQNH